MRKHKVRIHTTELELDLTEDQITDLLGKLVTKQERATVSEAAEGANDESAMDYTDLGAVSEDGEGAIQPRPRRAAVRNGGGEAFSMMPPEGEELQRFNGALKKHTEPGKQALLALRLAQTAAKDGLTSTQVAKLLQEHFKVSAKEPAIRMALVRGASKDPMLVIANKTRDGTVYRLTRQGVRNSDALLN